MVKRSGESFTKILGGQIDFRWVGKRTCQHKDIVGAGNDISEGSAMCEAERGRGQMEEASTARLKKLVLYAGGLEADA